MVAGDRGGVLCLGCRVLIAAGLFPRRIDAIILIWLAITFANELTIDVPLAEKLFLADDSGFFAVWIC